LEDAVFALVLSAALGAVLLISLISGRTISDGTFGSTLGGTPAPGQEGTRIAQVDPCKPNKCR